MLKYTLISVMPCISVVRMCSGFPGDLDLNDYRVRRRWIV